MKLMLGMGCDRGASLETLLTAVDQALAQIDQNRDAVTALASIDKKNDEVALLALAEQQKWPLHFFSAAQLAQVEVPNPSAVVLKYMGTPAVAEAAALLAAQKNMNDLLVEKYKYLGADGKNATVSIVSDGTIRETEKKQI
ncbi:MAG: cobalamin biosynthesis protein [Gammaproteobacteria bacterium]|nr:cobalamin biosynthesis protein [Gammaproteobacteria bacterium]